MLENKEISENIENLWNIFMFMPSSFKVYAVNIEVMATTKLPFERKRLVLYNNSLV